MASDCRLLVLSCSQRKRHTPGLLPAIERYDGVSFRVLRKAQREGYWPKSLDILILSAKYGLIDATTPIAFYEQRMTLERATALKVSVLEKLSSLIEQHDYREVYLDLGQDYLPAIGGCTEIFSGMHVMYAKGRIGERLRGLRNWLRAKSEE